MELGEQVANAVLGKNVCTFCDQEKSEGKDEAIAIPEHTSEDTSDPDAADDDDCMLCNDAGLLAKALGRQPFKAIDGPVGAPLKKGYWEGNKSRFCGNAHHLIPGNASLAKCTCVLKWMAKKVTVTKVRYTAKAPAWVGVQAPNWIGARTTSPAPGVVETTTVSMMTKGAKVETSKVVQGRVTGKVVYDLNAATNGVWLPSNNAVDGWRKNTSPEFKSRYARLAMSSSEPPRQFHDAHPAYSDEVIKQLGCIEFAIRQRADACKANAHGTADANGVLPAPQKLPAVLNRLATELRTKLVGTPMRWSSPYYTSQRSLTNRPGSSP
jgi:hypothetical protein